MYTYNVPSTVAAVDAAPAKVTEQTLVVEEVGVASDGSNSPLVIIASEEELGGEDAEVTGAFSGQFTCVHCSLVPRLTLIEQKEETNPPPLWPGNVCTL